MAGVEIQEAIRCRILELAAQRKWSVNKLAERSGIAPSVLKRTVKSLRNSAAHKRGDHSPFVRGVGNPIQGILG